MSSRQYRHLSGCVSKAMPPTAVPLARGRSSFYDSSALGQSFVEFRAMARSPLQPRSGSSAKALLLTVLGELVLPGGGAVWTQTVVQLLGRLDVGERNARQA